MRWPAGCAILGTGGGGDPRIGLLLALQALEEVGPTELVDLDDLPDDALIMPCGMVGAPTVHIEKIENGGEGDVSAPVPRAAHRPCRSPH